MLTLGIAKRRNKHFTYNMDLVLEIFPQQFVSYFLILVRCVLAELQYLQNNLSQYLKQFEVVTWLNLNKIAALSGAC